ncbi:MAG TPA: type II toxin-antitoxin system MqsA family antitoxin [Tepidisphaeraceae bacterium]|jgi:YgiT-type zinc finger domain-containing protein|nr:type II toxin-antitoxin system MqsA family antitoxin [Tepidisphaeraceae bacterium]
MKCVICKHGKTVPARVSVTLERGASTLVFKSVPAEVCENCGEQYVSEETTRRLLREAERAVGAGVQVEIRGFGRKIA